MLYPEEEYEEYDYEPYVYREAPALPLHLLPDFTLPVGIAAVLFVIYVLTRGGPVTGLPVPLSQVRAPEPVQSAPALAQPTPLPETLIPAAFAAPYADYVITQGIHGASYGQMAIDLAAGKGAAILSPINGAVARHETDRYGNPTLVIENEIYVVTMLHGIYAVEEGDVVRLGDPVGVESNLGYTTDIRGVPCAGRTDYCGYHTHINVYDKRIGENVNPLTLFQP